MSIMEKVKLLITIKKPAEELLTEVQQAKEKYKSISFWMTVIMSLSALASSLMGYLPPKIGVALTITIGCVYNVLRAIQNAQIEGVTPLIYSTRFWCGLVSIFSGALIALQDGGISADWIKSAIGIMGSVMAIAQAVGSIEPKKISLDNPAPNPSDPPK